MDAMNGLIEAENQRRETNARTTRVDTSRFLADMQIRQNNSAAIPSDQAGYWVGSTFVTYFVIGQSLLGGTDVLE